MAVKDSARYIDISMRFRLYKRGPDGKAVRTDTVSETYGGVWDSLLRSYVPDKEPQPIEFSVHEGQWELLTADRKTRVKLILASPGYGKTDALILLMLRDMVEIPRKPHLYVAPTTQKLTIGWNKYKKLIGSTGWSVSSLEAIKAPEEVAIANGSRALWRAAKKQSEDLGSPIAGIDAATAKVDESQNVKDEDLREVQERGRIFKDFQMIQTATNERIPEFRRRKREYARAKWAEVLMGPGETNCFTPLSHWQKLKEMYPPDEYKRKILCLDVPDVDSIYSAFSESSVRPISASLRDITAAEVNKKFPDIYDCQWVLGTDFGITVHVSTAMQIFLDPSQKGRVFYARHEIVTRQRTADFHADAIKEWAQEQGVDPARILLIADPHTNKKDEDPDSDYRLVRKSGLLCLRAHGGNIPRKHRYTMMNTLLRDASGKQRLFIESSPDGKSSCPKLEESFYGLKYRRQGVAPEAHGKNPDLDLTHYTDSIGYSLWKWERFRGEVGSTKPESEKANKWAYRRSSMQIR